MISKEDFYHGAAIRQLLASGSKVTLLPTNSGYLVGEDVFALVKYSCKTRGPWRFTLGASDIERLNRPPIDVTSSVLSLVCGGDGICAVSWYEIAGLLSEPPAWVAVRRYFSGQYAVSGALGDLSHRVARKDWITLTGGEIREWV